MPHPPYLLRLGEATLVFFPPQAELGLHAPHVAQVMIKPQTASPTREEVAAFCDAQEDITAAVQGLLLKNITTPLHKHIEVEFQAGSAVYVLVGEKRKWVYGQGLDLKWGEDEVRKCADKWIFRFGRRECLNEDAAAFEEEGYRL